MQFPQPVTLPRTRGRDALHPWDRGRLSAFLSGFEAHVAERKTMLGQHLEACLLELSPRALVVVLHAVSSSERTYLASNVTEVVMMLLESTLTTADGCSPEQSADVIADLGELNTRQVSRLRAQACATAVAGLISRATDEGNAPVLNELGVKMTATLVPWH